MSSMEPSLIGSASAPISMGRRFLGSSDMGGEANSWVEGQTVPVATMEAVGTTEPPAGSAVMLSCMGWTDPAMVKRGLLRRRAEQAQRDRLVAHDPPELVGAARVQLGQVGRDQEAPPVGHQARIRPAGGAWWSPDRPPGDPGSEGGGHRGARLVAGRLLKVRHLVIGLHEADAEDDGHGSGGHGEGGDRGDGAPAARRRGVAAGAAEGRRLRSAQVRHRRHLLRTLVAGGQPATMPDHRPSGGSSTELPRAPATSRNSSSSARQRGQVSRCSSTSVTSSASTAWSA